MKNDYNFPVQLNFSLDPLTTEHRHRFVQTHMKNDYNFPVQLNFSYNLLTTEHRHSLDLFE